MSRTAPSALDGRAEEVATPCGNGSDTATPSSTGSSGSRSSRACRGRGSGMASRKSRACRGRSALVLYGSETGNAQDVAEEIGRVTQRLRFATTVLDLDSAEVRDLLAPSVLIVALSTSGQGELPHNARSFWRLLLSGALKPGLLRRLRFTSFGLGDSSYPRYNSAHRLLHSRLVQLGGRVFCPRGEGDEQHPEGHSAGFREWIGTLHDSLVESYPLTDGHEIIAEDCFLEPKWRLAFQRDTPAVNGQSVEVVDEEREGDKSSLSALLPMKEGELHLSALLPSLPMKEDHTIPEVINKEREEGGLPLSALLPMKEGELLGNALLPMKENHTVPEIINKEREKGGLPLSALLPMKEGELLGNALLPMKEDHTVPEIINKEREKGELPSIALLPIKEGHTAELITNDRITPESHFQDVRVLDLRIGDKLSYGPGAVALIYPKNFPQDVHDFIKLMRWDEIADTPIELLPAKDAGRTPSPLRLVDLEHSRLTMRTLLSDYLDIMSIPRRSFFASLAYFARTDTEDARYQKDRLLELANPALIDELWDYTTRPKRTILEVMLDFTTIKIPWQYAFSALPIMRGRQFSIASGGTLQTDAEGRTRIQLLVAIADPPSPIIKYRRRYGVCTRYIANLKAGQQLTIGLQQGYLDVRPAELSAPVLMIGPGTGLAPMRALIHQRLAWALASPDPPAKPLAGSALFFGCRDSSADYFFQHEWPALEQQGLQLFTAFSRDAQQPRQYVQDLLRANAPLVYSSLVPARGRVYVCGASGNMPKGVREALLDVLGAQGGMASAAAEAHLARMEKEARYKQETW